MKFVCKKPYVTFGHIIGGKNCIAEIKAGSVFRRYRCFELSGHGIIFLRREADGLELMETAHNVAEHYEVCLK